jgi:hypothetical protein
VDQREIRDETPLEGSARHAIQEPRRAGRRRSAPAVSRPERVLQNHAQLANIARRQRWAARIARNVDR